MKLQTPSPEEAKSILLEAETMNPGPWIVHSLYAAEAARNIAARHSCLDPEVAFSMGCLHDIGRKFGVYNVPHVINGYRYMNELGYADVARICMTHSFPVPDVECYLGKRDASNEDMAFIRRYLANSAYDEYDFLIQLCDALAMPNGFCLIEKRMMDAAIRHGLNNLIVEKWRKTIEIREHFEAKVGGSIYALLPGVVENTFGFDIKKR